jgi:VIT1/CCC1 family predicted Fe2+/Mn2+ transporter
MATNDELIRAIQRFADQQGVYRAELVASLRELQRRLLAGEKLLLDIRQKAADLETRFTAEIEADRHARHVLTVRFWFLFGAIVCVVLLFLIMALLSFRK